MNRCMRPLNGNWFGANSNVTGGDYGGTGDRAFLLAALLRFSLAFNCGTLTQYSYCVLNGTLFKTSIFAFLYLASKAGAIRSHCRKVYDWCDLNYSNSFFVEGNPRTDGNSFNDHPFVERERRSCLCWNGRSGTWYVVPHSDWQSNFSFCWLDWRLLV